MRRLLLPLLPVAAAAILVSACGSSGTSNPAASASKAPAATVTTSGSKLGTILTDAHHRTLYLFEKDKGGMSSCSGACASLWPPLMTAGKNAAASGQVSAKLLGTTKRSGGATQVTYNGHPLYFYAGDQHAGQTTGQDLNQFGAPWYVVAPSGNKIGD